MSDNAASFVGPIPQEYDRGLGPVIFVDYAADMARRVAALAPAKVLELAAGTGIVTRMLRDRLPAASHLTATDLNPPMLEIARTKFQPGESVDFQQADATSLPFADGSFDAVVCQFGIMFFPDKERSYREARRVLVPGGRYLFSVWDAHRHNAFGRIAQETVMRFFPTDPPRFYQVPFSSHAIDPIKEALAEAGFGEISIHVLTMEKTVPDVATFARGLIYGNPVVEEIRSRGGASPDEVVAALGAALGEKLDTSGRIKLQTILFEAKSL